MTPGVKAMSRGHAQDAWLPPIHLRQEPHRSLRVGRNRRSALGVLPEGLSV